MDVIFGYKRRTDPISRASEKGFTLVELMLVVIIIGVLSAVVVPRLVGRTERARIAATELTLKGVATALGAFELDIGRFPTTEEGIAALLHKPSALTAEAEWQGPYLPEEALDAWKRPLIFKSPGDEGVDFDLSSTGPDGQQGTEDDITNFLNKP